MDKYNITQFWGSGYDKSYRALGKLKADVLQPHLNLVACVSTVTEKPRTPEVFLQVGYT